MDGIFIGVSLLVFVGVAFFVEAIWQWWFSTQSKAARRTTHRLQAMMPSAQGNSDNASLWRQRSLSGSAWIEQWLGKMPGIVLLDRFLQQSGSQWQVDRLLATSLACLLIGWMLGLLFLHTVGLAIVMGILSACLPFLWLTRLRLRRLMLLERQLPEAADLIARSLRAGHALSSTLQMVADEMPEPISDEFRIVSDEIHYGPGLQQALQHLADRVPLDDLRFFVISILIQRETGGNLSELMGNIAALIRQRLKFFGEIRSLSAEGKLSAWILFALPLVMAVLLTSTNPEYMGKLTTDPTGIKLLYASAALQMFGGFWMYRIIQIRV